MKEKYPNTQNRALATEQNFIDLKSRKWWLFSKVKADYP
jgi:hypothetical protein